MKLKPSFDRLSSGKVRTALHGVLRTVHEQGKEKESERKGKDDN